MIFSRRRCSTRSLLCAVVSIFLVGCSVHAVAHSLEAGGGVHIPFGGDERSQFGTGTAFTLGYSLPLTPGHSSKDTWLILEAAYISGTGEPDTSDPTFVAPAEQFWFLPLVVGVRTNFVSKAHASPVGVYGGICLASVLSGYQDINGKTRTSPTLGVAFELRPEFKMSPGFSLWVRQRISVLGSVNYSNSSGSLNYSGSTLQLGLTYKVK